MHAHDHGAGDRKLIAGALLLIAALMAGELVAVGRARQVGRGAGCAVDGAARLFVPGG